MYEPTSELELQALWAAAPPAEPLDDAALLAMAKFYGEADDQADADAIHYAIAA
jgi:hypothetical protein